MGVTQLVCPWQGPDWEWVWRRAAGDGAGGDQVRTIRVLVSWVGGFTHTHTPGHHHTHLLACFALTLSHVGVSHNTQP